MENESREAWKALLDTFYDSETLEVRPGCDQLFEDLLSMQLAICSRLAQTGHEKEALRLWNHITTKRDETPPKERDNSSSGSIKSVECPETDSISAPTFHAPKSGVRPSTPKDPVLNPALYDSDQR